MTKDSEDFLPFAHFNMASHIVNIFYDKPFFTSFFEHIIKCSFRFGSERCIRCCQFLVKDRRNGNQLL